MLTRNISNSISPFPLVIFYCGNYENAPTDSIVSIIEANERSAKRKSQLKKLMFLSVEAIQNVQRYSVHSSAYLDSSMVICDGKTYQVITSNLVRADKTEELIQRFNDLRAKTKEELELHYFNSVASEEKTEKGSGLGLIEIARKTDSNFLFRVNKVNEDHSLFELCFAFPADKEEPVLTDLNVSLDLHQKIYNDLDAKNSSFLFSGDFSNNFLLAVLDLLLSKTSEGTVNTNKKNHHILIELIQNIRRHGKSGSDSSKGKLLLEWKDQKMIISTQNSGTEKDIDIISKKIVNLNGLNKQELELKSKEILLDMEATNGLGLIDIASLIYPNRISMETYPNGEGFTEINLSLISANE